MEGTDAARFPIAVLAPPDLSACHFAQIALRNRFDPAQAESAAGAHDGRESRDRAYVCDCVGCIYCVLARSVACAFGP